MEGDSLMSELGDGVGENGASSLCTFLPAQRTACLSLSHSAHPYRGVALARHATPRLAPSRQLQPPYVN